MPGRAGSLLYGALIRENELCPGALFWRFKGGEGRGFLIKKSCRLPAAAALLYVRGWEDEFLILRGKRRVVIEVFRLIDFAGFVVLRESWGVMARTRKML